MSAGMIARRPPRHQLSPRARRLAAESDNAAAVAPQRQAFPSPAATLLAVAEVEVDLTWLPDDVVPHLVKAAVDAMPARPVHLAIGQRGLVIHDAGDLSIAGLTRRLSEPGPDGDSSGANLTIVVSSLLSETLPVEPGQIGTLVAGAAMQRSAVVRIPTGETVIAVRSFARLNFSYDHQAIGRGEAARFLTAVKHRLEAPWTSAG